MPKKKTNGVRNEDLYGSNGSTSSTGLYFNDVYKASKEEYDDFVANNREEIESMHAKNPSLDTNTVNFNAYLNHIIKNNLGEDVYNANYKGKSINDKIALYNEAAQYNGDVADVTEEIASEFESPTVTPEEERNAQYWNGDIAPQLFKIGDKSQTMDSYFGNTAKMEYSESADFLPRLANRFYREDAVSIPESSYGTAIAENKLDEYASFVRSQMDNDPKLTKQYWSIFRDNVLKNSRYWNNYHDTADLLITPNDMKDIMAKYYAINTMENSQQAQEYVDAYMQNTVASNIGFGRKLQASLVGLGANYLGNAITTAGVFLNSPVGLVRAIKKSDDIDGANLFKEWLYYSGQNNITQYGLDVINTGAWNKEVQDFYKSTNFNRGEVVRKYGQESNFLDPTTALDVFAQMGFTMSGAQMAKIATNIFKSTVEAAAYKGAERILAGEANTFRTLAAKYITTAGKVNTVAAVSTILAAGEAAVDANEIYNRMMGNQEDYLKTHIQRLLDTPEMKADWENYYNNNMQYALPSVEVHSELDEDSLRRLYLMQATEAEELRKQWIVNKTKELMAGEEGKKLLSELENTALRASVRNMTDETLFIAFGDALFSNMLGRGFKQAKKEVRLALGRSNGQFSTFRNADGLLRVEKPDVTDFNRWRALGIGARETIWEGIEEHFQTVDTEIRNDLADEYIYQYIMNRYNPDALSELSDTIWNNWGLVANSYKDNAFSKEAVYSFLLGAVSAGIGSPTIAHGIGNMATKGFDAYRGKNAWETTTNVLNDFWRNPFVEAWQEEKHIAENERNEIDQMNDWLEQHEEVARLQDYNSIVGWLYAQQNAALADSDKDFRDARMGQKVATLLMMDKLKGSVKEMSFSERLNQMQNLTINDEEAAEIIERARKERGDDLSVPISREEQEEILNEVKAEAKKMKELQDNLRRIKSMFSSRFNESISEDMLDSMSYEMIMLEDNKDRIKNMNEEIRNAYETSANVDTGERGGTVVSNIKAAYARYGSIEGAKRALAALQEEKRKTKKESSSFIRKNKVRSINQKIKAVRKDLVLMNSHIKEGGIADYTTRAEEIAYLDENTRARLLDVTRKDSYSKEQLDEIEKFKNATNVTDDILVEIQDAASLKERLDIFSQSIKDITKDNRSIITYENGVRREAAKKLLNGKIEELNSMTDYNEFKSAMDTFYKGNPTYIERDVLENGINNKSLYERYLKELRDRGVENAILRKTPAYKELSEDEQMVIRELYKQGLVDGDTSLDHLIDILTSEEFKSDIMKNNPNNDNLRIVLASPTINQNIINILQQVKNQKANADGIAEYMKKLEADRGRSGGKNEIIKSTDGKKSISIFNKDKFNRYKSRYQKLFDRLSNWIQGKTNIVLNKSEFIDFFNLFSSEEIGEEFIVDDSQIPTEITSMNELVEFSRSLNTAIENKQFTDPNAYTTAAFQNTLQLRNAIDKFLQKSDGYGNISFQKRIKSLVTTGMIEVDNGWKDVFDKKVNKDIKKVKLGQYRIQRLSDVSLKAVKDFYAKNHIQDNLAKLHEYNNKNRGNKNARIAFIVDSELNNKILEELKADNNGFAFDYDNLPIVVAAIVDDSINGAIEIDGKRYLYIGMLQDSRRGNEIGSTTVNSLNSLRQYAIDNEISGVIKNPDGSEYISRGMKMLPVSSVDRVRRESVKEYLLAQNGGDLEAAYRDFKNGVREVKLTPVKGTEKPYGDKTRMKVTVEVSYTDSDGIVHISNQIETDWEAGRKSYTTVGYVDESYDKNQVWIFRYKPADEMEIPFFKENTDGSVSEVETKSVWDILNSIDNPEVAEEDKIVLADSKYTHLDANQIRRAILAVSNAISKSVSADTIATGELKNRINKAFAYSTSPLNIKKKAGMKSAFEIVPDEIKPDKDGNRILTLYLTEPSVINGARIPLGSINLSEFIIHSNDKAEQQQALRNLHMFSQRIIKNLLYDTSSVGLIGEPTVRSYENGNNIEPLIKINFDNRILEGSDISAQRLAFFSNVIDMVYNPDIQFKEDLQVYVNEPIKEGGHVPEGVTYNEVADWLGNYKIENEDDHRSANKAESGLNRVLRAVGVTTFIHGRNNRDITEADQIAMTLGTSIDKMFRMYLNMDRSSYITGTTSKRDAYRDAELFRAWMRSAPEGSSKRSITTWVGFNTNKNSDGVDELAEIFKKFDVVLAGIEERGETVVTGTYRFRGVVHNGKGGKQALTAIPDLLTLDSEGGIHIYDFKSFIYDASSRTPVRLRFTGRSAYINGLGRGATVIKEWSEQLSLYTAIINSLFAHNAPIVKSISVIPISLKYNPAQYRMGTEPSDEMPEVGEKVFKIHKRNTDKKHDYMKLGGKEVDVQSPIIIQPTPLYEISSKNWGAESTDYTVGTEENSLDNLQRSERFEDQQKKLNEKQGIKEDNIIVDVTTEGDIQVVESNFDDVMGAIINSNEILSDDILESIANEASCW